MKYQLKSYGRSELGRRETNEDDWQEVPGQKGIVLADGLGGHQAGEIASHEAVRVCCEEILQLDFETLEEKNGGEMFKSILSKANFHVLSLAQADPALEGMGTTLCLLAFGPLYAHISHIGDSRVYRVREEKLLQVTQDHSLLNKYLAECELTEEEAVHFPHRHVLTQAVGTTASVKPSYVRFDLQKGDRYLLCSDGLSDVVDFEEIEDILTRQIDVQEAVDALVRLGLRRGNDNVTVVCVEVC